MRLSQKVSASKYPPTAFHATASHSSPALTSKTFLPGSSPTPTRKRVSYVLKNDLASTAHLLGVNALAVDRTIRRLEPTHDEDVLTKHVGGILYTGGRDGMVASWNLNVPMRNRLDSHRERSKGSDEGLERWCVDAERVERNAPPRTTFRQSFEHHTDWVNDILLCHEGQTLISASSDRTIKLWRPHAVASSTIPDTTTNSSPFPEENVGPYHLGDHTDYVRCLAHASKGTGWVASGGFDRRINIWDPNRAGGLRSGGDPVVSIGETSLKSSIYALACNPTGTVLVSGSPEKVIRVWDPRSGRRIAKFTGHTDNIRALLVSDDGRLILSASSDTTVKLWSLPAQRCMATYTCHPDSVWSLSSECPRLGTFYAGCKNGLVTRTEIWNERNSHGESVSICKEKFGVTRLALLDNEYLWTATSCSDVNRWRDVPASQRRTTSLPASCMINLPAIDSAIFTDRDTPSINVHNTISSPKSPNFTPIDPRNNASNSNYVSIRDPEPLRGAAPSVLSVSLSVKGDEGAVEYAPNHCSDTVWEGVNGKEGDGEEFNEESVVVAEEKPDETIQGKTGIVKHLTLSNRRNVLTLDTAGQVGLWDIIQCQRVREFANRDFNEVAEELATVDSIVSWCSVDTKIGALTVTLDVSRCFDAEIYYDEAISTPVEGEEVKEDQRINLGKWVLRYLFSKYIQTRFGVDDMPSHEKNLDELESSHFDRRTNATGKDETVGNEHSTFEAKRPAPVELGPLPPPNVAAQSYPTPGNISTLPGTPVPPKPLIETPFAQTTPLSTIGGLSYHATDAPRNSVEAPSNYKGPRLSAAFSGTISTPIVSPPPPAMNAGGDYFSSSTILPGQPRCHSPTSMGRAGSPPLARTRPYSASASKLGTTEKTNGFQKETKRTMVPLPELPQAPPATFAGTGSENSVNTGRFRPYSVRRSLSLDGSLNYKMGSNTWLASSSSSCISPSRLNTLPPPVISNQSSSNTSAPGGNPTGTTIEDSKQRLARFFSNTETPFISIPEDTPLSITEEIPEASTAVDVWRGTVGSLRDLREAERMERVAPGWLIEYILKNKVPLKDPVKLPFILQPFEEPDSRLLPELPVGNTRLTANRMLRVRKLLAYVVEKLEIEGPHGTKQASKQHAPTQRPTPPIESQEKVEVAMLHENWIELVCAGQTLSPNMTLATIRTHVWRQGGDIRLAYRLKTIPASIDNSK